MNESNHNTIKQKEMPQIVREAIEDYMTSGYMQDQLEQAKLHNSLVDVTEINVLLAYMTLHVVERQEQISQAMYQSVDESTKVAKHVRTLTIFIGVLTLISVVATVIAYWKDIKALFI